MFLLLSFVVNLYHVFFELNRGSSCIANITCLIPKLPSGKISSPYDNIKYIVEEHEICADLSNREIFKKVMFVKSV